MASVITNLWSRLRTGQQASTIMIIGLDNSGKTCILEEWRNGEMADRTRRPNEQRRKSVHSRRNLGNSCDSQPRVQSRNKTFDERLARTSQWGNQNDEFKALVSDVNNPMGVGDGSEERVRGDTRPTLGYNWERIIYKGRMLNVLDFSGKSRYRALWQEFYNCVDGIVFVIDSSDLIRLVVVRDELESLLSNAYFSTLKPSSGDSSSTRSTEEEKLGPQMASATELVQKRLILRRNKLTQIPIEASIQISGASSSDSIESQLKRSRVPILFLANKTDLANSVDTEAIAKALNLDQVPTGRHPWFIQATSISTRQGIGDGIEWLLSKLTS